MIQRLGGQTVVFRDAIGGISGVGKQAPALAEHLRVEPYQTIAKADVLLVVAEVAERRAAQLVGGAVLVDQPGDLVWVADE